MAHVNTVNDNGNSSGWISTVFRALGVIVLGVFLLQWESLSDLSLGNEKATSSNSVNSGGAEFYLTPNDEDTVINQTPSIEVECDQI